MAALKHDEADDINRGGIKDQMAYLCEADAEEWCAAVREMVAEYTQSTGEEDEREVTG